MDERSQQMLKEVLDKDPSELTENDKALIRARWSYVGKNSRQKFAEVLQESGTVKTESKPQEPQIQNEKKNSPDLSQHPADQDDDDEDSTDGDQDSDQDEQ